MFQFEVENEKPIEEEIVIQKKSKSPFDFSSSIDQKNNLRNELDGYSPWMVNKIFSMYRDTIFIANEINKYNIDNRLHYDYFFHFVSKKKRFAKWSKPKYNEDDIKLIIEYFNINHRKALDIIDLVDLEFIKKSFYHGGIKK